MDGSSCSFSVVLRVAGDIVFSQKLSISEKVSYSSYFRLLFGLTALEQMPSQRKGGCFFQFRAVILEVICYMVNHVNGC